MAVLASAVTVSGRFARSANLERDAARAEPLDGYVLTAKGIEVLDRIAATAAEGPSGGAWSLTGPYGSGKSSLGLLLDAAFSGDSPLRRRAEQLIGEASPSTGDMLRRAHGRHGTSRRGFNRGIVTATREPLARTVARALQCAVRRTDPPPPEVDAPRAGRELLNALAASSERGSSHVDASPSSLVKAARVLAAEAPLLLVIDEFGKNLEAVRDGGDADPYLLQQLAEAGQGSGLPIFVVTLQHLSFEDCLAGADRAQRREWAKVQGRFEDVSFVESASGTRALIGTVFDVADPDLQVRVDRWARSQARTMQSLGIAELADPATVAATYPLHPLAALVLPELCNRYGQYERTLFSFLAGPHPSSAASFLSSTRMPARGALPSVGLDAVYDYFVGSGALSITEARQSSRWTEVATRLRDCHGLTPTQARVAKSVALLNLVSTSGTVRASRRLLEMCARGAAAALDDLERDGVIVYRQFADEYRVWQGTDVEVGALMEEARRRVQSMPLVEVVSQIDTPVPVVAARHSAQHDVLRLFRRRYAEAGEPVEPLDALSPYDGEVLLIVGSDGRLPRVTASGSGITPLVAADTALAVPAPRSGSATKPVIDVGTADTAPAAPAPRWGSGSKPIIAAVPDNVAGLDAAARELAAVMSVLDDPGVTRDRVALREVGEQLAQVRVDFEHALTETFGPECCRWMLLAHEPEAVRGLDGETNPANTAAGDGDAAGTDDVHDSDGVIGAANRPAGEAHGSDDKGSIDAITEAGADNDTGDSTGTNAGHGAGNGAVELAAGRGSAALSAAADLAYPLTPRVGNEMLNRSELTSQGAKARRLLLEAMIERGEQDYADLGFDGHGPETAMYRAFLARTGLHGRDRDGAMRFGRPTDESLQPAWDLLEAEFRRSTDCRVNLAQIYATLMSPPVGMKAAVVPVLVTAGLLAFRDEVAIYEHGTFRPLLSPEVSERMVRNPAHFDIKHFANTSGGRLAVVEALADRLGLTAGSRPDRAIAPDNPPDHGIAPDSPQVRGIGGARRDRGQRVANVLAVVTPMVSRVAKLDNYTRRTGRLQPAALAVREALASAVEPDELLFVTLPEALGFDPVTADTPACGYAAQFATAVAAALDELSACLDGLLDELLVLLLDSAGASRTGAVVGQAAMLGDEVLDPEVRAFVLALANDGCDSDAAWISAVATVVARRAPAEWNDDDRTRFCRELPPRLAAFHRLVALHAERRADGGGPFDALRVTVTRPDGVEHIRLVGVDARHRGELEQTLDGALDRLVPIAGSSQRAQHGLLGLLAERLLEEREADARLLPAVAASRAPHDSDPDHATSSIDDPPAVPNGATPDSGSSHAGPAAGDPAPVPGRGGLGVAAKAVGDG